MEAMVSARSDERVSAAVIGTVMECHDRGFHFLVGAVPEAADAKSQEVSDRWRELSNHWRTYFLMYARRRISKAAAGSSPLTTQVMDFADGGPDVEPTATEGAAVRHLGELMRLGREGKMRYLSDAGMGKSEITRLVELVVGWVNEAGLDRLGELSIFASQSELGPGCVLQAWMDAECRLSLAFLLDGEFVEGSGLAAAYAVSHAAELVLASYEADLVDDDSPLFLVPGDDLD